MELFAPLVNRAQSTLVSALRASVTARAWEAFPPLTAHAATAPGAWTLRRESSRQSATKCWRLAPMIVRSSSFSATSQPTKSQSPAPGFSRVARPTISQFAWRTAVRGFSQRIAAAGLSSTRTFARSLSPMVLSRMTIRSGIAAMTRAARFSQADLTRAVRAAEKAG
jgi:hypothetical protein